MSNNDICDAKLIWLPKCKYLFQFSLKNHQPCRNKVNLFLLGIIHKEFTSIIFFTFYLYFYFYQTFSILYSLKLSLKARFDIFLYRKYFILFLFRDERSNMVMNRLIQPLQRFLEGDSAKRGDPNSTKISPEETSYSTFSAPKAQKIRKKLRFLKENCHLLKL